MIEFLSAFLPLALISAFIGLIAGTLAFVFVELDKRFGRNGHDADR